jgi:hypothetical protein
MSVYPETPPGTKERKLAEERARMLAHYRNSDKEQRRFILATVRSFFAIWRNYHEPQGGEHPERWRQWHHKRHMLAELQLCEWLEDLPD